MRAVAVLSFESIKVGVAPPSPTPQSTLVPVTLQNPTLSTLVRKKETTLLTYFVT